MLSQAVRKIEHRQINANMMGSVFERLIGGEVRRFHFDGEYRSCQGTGFTIFPWVGPTGGA